MRSRLHGYSGDWAALKTLRHRAHYKCQGSLAGAAGPPWLPLACSHASPPRAFPSHRRLNDRAPALAAVLPAATVRPGCDRSSGLRSTLKWADLKLKQSGNGYQTATVQVCRGWGWAGEGGGRDGRCGLDNHLLAQVH